MLGLNWRRESSTDHERSKTPMIPDSSGIAKHGLATDRGLGMLFLPQAAFPSYSAPAFDHRVVRTLSGSRRYSPWWPTCRSAMDLDAEIGNNHTQTSEILIYAVRGAGTARSLMTAPNLGRFGSW